MLDSTPLTDVVLPPELQPTAPPLNGSFGVGQFFMLDDGVTGVLALGSFSGADFDTMESGLLEGLLGLKSMGATQLIVDVVCGIVVMISSPSVFICLLEQQRRRFHLHRTCKGISDIAIHILICSLSIQLVPTQSGEFVSSSRVCQILTAFVDCWPQGFHSTPGWS